MKCIVCSKELDSPLQPCPRCGFLQPAVVGDAAGAEAFIAGKAKKHKQELSSRYDIGLTIYRWKDQNGTVALQEEQRLSFGKGDALMEREVWLEQPFARIPEAAELELALSVAFGEEAPENKTVSVPVPEGKHLLQVGARLDGDFSLRLMLKNPEGQTESRAVYILRD